METSGGSGGGGSPLTVTDGVHTVTNVTEVSFTGATVSNGGGGIADVSIGAGGSNTQLQYNNSGVLGGISGATSNGTVVTFASSSILIKNPAATFSYTIAGSAITAARTLTLPLITASDTLASLGLAQTFTASQTFNSSVPQIQVGVTGSSVGRIRFNNSSNNNTIDVQATISTSASYVLSLPVNGGTSGYSLITDGFGGTSWAARPTSVSNSDGSLTISPTTGAVVASLNLANGNIWTAPQQFNANPGIILGNPGVSNGYLIFAHSGAGNDVVITSTGATGSGYYFVLPTSGGTSGYVLSTDGTGVTSWVPQVGTTFPLVLPQTTTPGSPPTGSDTLYPKSDDNLYTLTGSGLERQLAYIPLNENLQSTNYSLVIQDQIVFVDTVTAGADTTMTMPDPTTCTGYVFIIKDWSGSASANTIAIAPFGTELFDGNASLLINANYGAVKLVSDNTNWLIIP